jgi:hypothetical protein
MKRKDTKDTYSYKGWIISDNFLKRALAIWGYSNVVVLMILIPFYALIFIFVFIFSLLT